MLDAAGWITRLAGADELSDALINDKGLNDRSQRLNVRNGPVLEVTSASASFAEIEAAARQLMVAWTMTERGWAQRCARVEAVLALRSIN